MKRIFIVILAIILISSFIWGGCAKQAPAPAPAPLPAPAPAPAPTKVYQLKWNGMHTSDSDNGRLQMLFMDMVKKATGGRVEITYFPTETLGKVTDSLNMLKGGVCDIAFVPTVFFPAQFEMYNLLDAPFLGIANRTVNSKVRWELYRQGYFDKDFVDFKVLGFNTTPGNTLFLRKKVLTVEDFKGLKLRAPDALTNGLWGEFGATGVAMPTPELYMALDRGVIDGIVTGYESAISMKQYEVTKYCIWNPAISWGGMGYLMSKELWNKFPPDIQRNIDEVVAKYPDEYLRYYQDMDKKAPGMLKEKGVEVYDLSASETARLMKIAGSFVDKVLAEKEAKGLPAKKMMEQLKKIVASQ